MQKITYAQETMLRLKLLGQIDRIVDASKTSRAASTKVTTEIVSNNAVGLDLVHLGQTFTDLILWHGGTVWVQDFDDLSMQNK